MSSTIKKIQKNILKRKYGDFMAKCEESYRKSENLNTWTKSYNDDLDESTMSYNTYEIHPNMYELFTRTERRELQRMNLNKKE